MSIIKCTVHVLLAVCVLYMCSWLYVYCTCAPGCICTVHVLLAVCVLYMCSWLYVYCTCAPGCMCTVHVLLAVYVLYMCSWLYMYCTCAPGCMCTVHECCVLPCLLSSPIVTSILCRVFTFLPWKAVVRSLRSSSRSSLTFR